jgi:tRNA A-37 threonylcarbamoyl transferase component Bud32
MTLGLADGSSLVLQQVVRVVQKKRLVCIALWQGEMVYAKLFIGDKAKRYAERDANGIQCLQENHIATPALLNRTQVPKENAEVLLIKAHPQATNIEVVMQKSTGKERLGLALKVVEAVARLHLVNLIQTDLYFKNFLIEDKTVLTIDGDGIRQFSQLSDKQAIGNLSVLLSKLDVLEVEVWLPELLNRYRQVNPKPTLEINQIKRQSKTHRVTVSTQYATKKVFRQCSDVNIREHDQSFMAIASNFSSSLEFEALENIETDMEGALLLKDGNTCTVTLATLKQTPVVIKRYNIKNTMHRLSRLWRPSRASASWANAHRLTLLEIPTPAPVALLETRFFGLSGKAYFLSEYVESPDIAQCFAEATDQVARATLVRNTVELFYRLFLLKISHGDMKATNIKVIENTPMLIDLDSMQQHNWHYFAQKAHVRDLKRFMQNWKQDTSLYNAFLKNFKVIYADHAVLHKAHLI